ncbi:hypothetical protein J8273_5298 [Carpediemonas membranifera]|uniref:Uncharacterized protein n=1 Tax=Carpediemonas membranifera TaxID=201153 RepID=A0A8J6B3P1_9EUKA|nr:hypothetical protein J8273_5298 [Carpediemonas membranifera]|eukprot:KAG9392309.1 hypothetical protein J8273_5298 [Carpediemonas membranifera]
MSEERTELLEGLVETLQLRLMEMGGNYTKTRKQLAVWEKFGSLFGPNMTLDKLRLRIDELQRNSDPAFLDALRHELEGTKESLRQTQETSRRLTSNLSESKRQLAVHKDTIADLRERLVASERSREAEKSRVEDREVRIKELEDQIRAMRRERAAMQPPLTVHTGSGTDEVTTVPVLVQTESVRMVSEVTVTEAAAEPPAVPRPPTIETREEPAATPPLSHTPAPALVPVVETATASVQTDTLAPMSRMASLATEVEGPVQETKAVQVARSGAIVGSWMPVRGPFSDIQDPTVLSLRLSVYDPTWVDCALAVFLPAPRTLVFEVPLNSRGEGHAEVKVVLSARELPMLCKGTIATIPMALLSPSIGLKMLTWTRVSLDKTVGRDMPIGPSDRGEGFVEASYRVRRRSG